MVDISPTELESKLVSGFLAPGGQLAKTAVRILVSPCLVRCMHQLKSLLMAQTKILART